MNRSRAQVLAALAVVVVLAAALGVRWAGVGSPASAPQPLLARFDKPAPPARVSLPIHEDVPKVPCWSCPASESWPIRFRTDLDLLAPLGDGPANAALWLKDFAKFQGARLAEAEAAMKRRVEGPDDFGLVLPPGRPPPQRGGAVGRSGDDALLSRRLERRRRLDAPPEPSRRAFPGEILGRPRGREP